jgi:hypothetical protein
VLTASLRQLFAVLLLFLPVALFCWSSQETSPMTPDEYLHSLTGGKLFLLHFGDTAHAKVKKGDLHKIKVSCDLAVQIKVVRHSGTEVSFDWVEIGTPTVMRNFPCNCSDNNDHPQGTLTISQMAMDETAASLADSSQ